MIYKNHKLICILFYLVIFLFIFQEKGNSNEQNKYWLDKASYHKEKMEYTKAIAILESKINVTCSESLQSYLAKLYYLSGDSISALKLFKKIQDKNWQVLLYIALIYEDIGNINRATEYYIKSTTQQKNSIALYRLGKIYYSQNDYTHAITYFTELLNFDPSIRLSNYYLADCFLKIRDFPQAYIYFSKIIYFYPQNKKIRENFEFVKEKLGEHFFLTKKLIQENKRKKIDLPPYQKEFKGFSIRVGIATGLKQVSIKCGGDFIFSNGTNTFKGKAHIFYRIIFNKNTIIITDYATNRKYAYFRNHVKLNGGIFPFYICDIKYGQHEFWQKNIDRIYRGNFQILKRESGLTLVNILNIEEYLYGILPSEISPSAGEQALKAQAIAARTLAFINLGRHKIEGFDFCADVHCQVYQGLSVENQTTSNAIKKTQGEIITFHGKPIEAFYHANCGGCLRSDIFQQPGYLSTKFDKKNDSSESNKNHISKYFPLSSYEEEMWFMNELQSVFSYVPKSSFRWQRIYDNQDFQLVFGFSLQNLKTIVPEKKGQCFHYDKINISTHTNEIRLEGELKIRNYFDKIRSNAFKTEIKFSPTGKAQLFFLWGAGFGHAAGLSQEGAMNMSNEGYDYDEILKHYYHSTSIKKAY